LEKVLFLYAVQSGHSEKSKAKSLLIFSDDTNQRIMKSLDEKRGAATHTSDVNARVWQWAAVDAHKILVLDSTHEIPIACGEWWSQAALRNMGRRRSFLSKDRLLAAVSDTRPPALAAVAWEHRWPLSWARNNATRLKATRFFSRQAQQDDVSLKNISSKSDARERIERRQVTDLPVQHLA
jgi:hypothetical protein